MPPLRLAAVVLPPAALAVLGLFHPRGSLEAPELWRDLHIVALFLFPLLGVAPWLVLRRRHPRLAVVAAVLGFGYAAGYTALDVLAGIGVGALLVDGIDGRPTLFLWADRLGEPAAGAYLVATLLAAGASLRSRPAVAVPGAVLVVLGAASFLTSHIYPWRGVTTMVVLAVGWGLLAVATGPRATAPGPVVH